MLGTFLARGVVGSVPGLAVGGDRCPACDGERERVDDNFPVTLFLWQLLGVRCSVLRLYSSRAYGGAVHAI